MKSGKKKPELVQAAEVAAVRTDAIDWDFSSSQEKRDEKEIKTRAAYFLINGAPRLTLNARPDGRYRLLSGGTDFLAVKTAGITEVPALVYRFSDRDAEIFALVEELKRIPWARWVRRI